jgi:glycerophosphoryl diester phosphodiesterase
MRSEKVMDVNMTISPSMICGHRGAAERFPENTLAAFKGAREMGAGWVETDIQMLADGELVLFHDEKLGRTSDGDAILSTLTWAEVRHLDMGSWKAPEFKGETLVRMADLLAWQQTVANTPGVIWEMKLSLDDPDSRVKEAADRVAGRLSDVSPHRHVLTSFNRRFIAAVRHLLPEIPMALASVEFPDDWLTFCQHHRLQALHLDGSLLNESQVKRVKDTGLALRCFTINDAELAERLFDWGVDMIFTDSPDMFL